MYAWKVTRNDPSPTQTEIIGHFSGRRKALSWLLVAVQNDFSWNQRWPELQEFIDVDVSVEKCGKFVVWVTAVSKTRQARYSIHAIRIE